MHKKVVLLLIFAFLFCGTAGFAQEGFIEETDTGFIDESDPEYTTEGAGRKKTQEENFVEEPITEFVEEPQTSYEGDVDTSAPKTVDYPTPKPFAEQVAEDYSYQKKVKENKPFALRTSFIYSFLTDYTKVGDFSGRPENEAPEYNDAFRDGMGTILEFDYRLSDLFSLHLAGGYISYIGDSEFRMFFRGQRPLESQLGYSYEKLEPNDMRKTNFSNWEVIPIFTGVKFHFFKFDFLQSCFGKPKQGLDIYLRFDIGAAISLAVSSDIPLNFGITTDPRSYWKTSVLMLVGGGIGLEYYIPGTSISLFAEGRSWVYFFGPQAATEVRQEIDPSDPDDRNVKMFDGDDAFTFPVSAGIAFHF